MKNEILNVIETIKVRETKLEEIIATCSPDMVELNWKQLIKIRRYRNELEKEILK